MQKKIHQIIEKYIYGCKDQKEVSKLKKEISKLKNQINDRLNSGRVLSAAQYDAADFFGITIKYKVNYQLIRNYLKDIENQTNFKVHKSQMNELKKELQRKTFVRLTPEKTKEHRAEFTKSVKDNCIKEWEKRTSRVWSRYAQSLYNKEGVEIRKKGDYYDAHHIIENCVGGEHAWWNIIPARFPDKHQGGIHRKGSPVKKYLDKFIVYILNP